MSNKEINVLTDDQRGTIVSALAAFLSKYQEVIGASREGRVVFYETKIMVDRGATTDYCEVQIDNRGRYLYIGSGYDKKLVDEYLIKDFKKYLDHMNKLLETES